MAKKNLKPTQSHKGHSEHTQAADAQRGLPGNFQRPIKVVMLGAGSFFTGHLVNDLLRMPGLKKLEIALVDINKRRLATIDKFITRLALESDVAGKTTVYSTSDRLEALPGADYVVSCIEVSGVDCVRSDNDIPLEYKVDQCIGDTIGPGGLFKGLRTIPVWLEVLRDCERLCPNALVLNYTNPMNMMCLASGRFLESIGSGIQVVGLCHSVQGTSHALAKRAGVPSEELAFECAGINHLAWFTKLEHRGRDLYPKLKKMAEKDLAGKTKFDPDDPYEPDLVRKDMMLQFGAFITESSGHLSEYLPYYRKRKDLLKKYARSGYHGQSSFYADNWPTWRDNSDKTRKEKLKNKGRLWDEPRSWEYASWIIEAKEKDAPFRIHGNVMNAHRGLGKVGGGSLISNLPSDGCVEVACMVDGNGVNPTMYGRLPAQMAALCSSNMRVFDLAATATLEKSKEAAIHALMFDPLTSAVCCPAEIREMALKIFAAQKKYLRGYK